METKAIKDLKRGDAIQLCSGECATVIKVYRETIFAGDVWTVEHSQGQDTANGDDRVAMAPTI
jgi:preprotein translocase subunit YajC